MWNEMKKKELTGSDTNVEIMNSYIIREQICSLIIKI